MQISDVGAVAPASNRTYGIAAGDYDEDGDTDLIVGRVDGRIVRLSNNGNGTFAAPVLFTWKQTTFNTWAFAPADVNQDGNLDVVWGAAATSTGCSVSPIPVGGTCTTAGGTTINIADGDVRAFLGNGNGTFQENQYFVSGVRHNAGMLITDIGTDPTTLTSGDVDGDTDADLVVGSLDAAATNATVKLLRSNGAGGYGAPETIISQAQGTTAANPIYFPMAASGATTSPWGLALSDMNGDGDLDLWVGDRALYTYRYNNGGAGTFTLQQPNSGPPAGRERAYLDHDTFRANVGFTPALGAGDINGDGNGDLALGLQSGTQAPPAPPVVAHDGEILLDLSSGAAHSAFGPYADIGTVARSLAVADFTGDGYLDIVGGTMEGRLHLLRQLTPVDSDGDGVSDYVDNAPDDPNAARVDMNTDGSTNHQDQLDNDFDTVLGDPEQPGTWQRLGDPADPDDDNDGDNDAADNCKFTANASQDDTDEDGVGDVCDPLDDRDPDGDGVPTGPLPGDPLYDESLAAKILWSQGDTHFVIRIDALGRIFQNEFTQLMSDAAALSASDWAVKCWGNYGPGGGDPADPCGTDEGLPSQTLTLEGGRGVPVTTVTIPRLLWTDSPVIDWINDRNDNADFELGQHGTYHFNNTTNGDWASLPDRDFFSCEACGLTEAESYELLRIGNDTLLGNYDNAWVAQSGATGASPKINWGASSAHPLISYAPPFNADDATARGAVAQLGFRATSSSVFEENSAIFTPEGSHHEEFDQNGVFHASADLEFEPPETAGGTYNTADYADYLEANTQPGELNTWLIEEVEWSGRPCNDDPRLNPDGSAAPATCPEAGGAANNRENNTVYGPRWDGWMQLLDYVNDYPGGVAMTMGDAALAQGFDNAPTVANPGQEDSDSDGIGDVIDDASLAATDGTLTRNEAGALSASLTNGAGDPISGQEVTFSFDADGDATDETYTGTTDSEGIAEATVTPTRPTGPAAFSVDWDGLRAAAGDSGDLTIADASSTTLDGTNPASGQVTDSVTVGATLEDSSGDPLAGKLVNFSIGSASGSGTTDASGHASTSLTLSGPAGPNTLTASFAGEGLVGPSSDSDPFTVNKEDTALALADATAKKNARAVAKATLTQDGQPLAGKTIEFFVQDKVKGKTVYTSIGTAVTNALGVASREVPPNQVTTVKKPIRATFAGDGDFLTSTGNAFAYRV